MANIAGSLSQVPKGDIIDRAIGNFAKADPEYGKRVSDAVSALRKK